MTPSPSLPPHHVEALIDALLTECAQTPPDMGADRKAAS